MFSEFQWLNHTSFASQMYVGKKTVTAKIKAVIEKIFFILGSSVSLVYI